MQQYICGTSQFKAATLSESSQRLQSCGPLFQILEFNDVQTPQLPPFFMADPLQEATTLINRAGGWTTHPLLVHDCTGNTCRLLCISLIYWWLISRLLFPLYFSFPSRCVLWPIHGYFSDKCSLHLENLCKDTFSLSELVSLTFCIIALVGVTFNTLNGPQ